MSDGHERPARANRIGYPNLRQTNINGPMVDSRSDARLKSNNPTFHSSSLALPPAPSAVVRNGSPWTYSSFANTEDIPDYAKAYLSKASESIPLFRQGIIPSRSVPTSRNLESASEQAAVADNILSRHNSEFGNRLFPENATGGHASRTSQGLWSFQRNPALLTTTVNVTSAPFHDLGVSTAIPQLRASSEAVPPPQQSSETTLQVPKVSVVPRQQRLKKETDEHEEMNPELRSKLKKIIKEASSSAGKGAHDVQQLANNYARLGSQSLKDELERENKAKLESTVRKVKRGAQSNINQQVRKKKQRLLIRGYTVAVEELFEDKKISHAEKQKFMQEIKSLKAENQRLKSQSRGSSSMGPPHDDPFGGPPPSDFGKGVTAPDNSNLGGPGSSFHSSGGPALNGGSCGGKPLSESVSNAQVTTKLNAQGSVGSGNVNNCSTPVNHVLVCKCHASGKAKPPGFIITNSCDNMPEYNLPNPLSGTKAFGRKRT